MAYRIPSQLEAMTGADMPLIGYIDDVKRMFAESSKTLTQRDIKRAFNDGTLDRIIPPPRGLTPALKRDLMNDVVKDFFPQFPIPTPRFPYLPPPPDPNYQPPFAYRGPLPNPSTYKPSLPSSYLPRFHMPSDLMSEIDAPAQQALNANAAEFVPGALQGQGRCFFDDLY